MPNIIFTDSKCTPCFNLGSNTNLMICFANVVRLFVIATSELLATHFDLHEYDS